MLDLVPSAVVSHRAEEAVPDPVWRALSTNLRRFRVGPGPVLQMRPEYGAFAAVAPGADPRALHRAFRDRGREMILMQKALPDLIAFGPLATVLPTIQMRAGAPFGPNPDGLVQLGPRDFDQMLSLARRTQPGPFARETGALGRFWGIRYIGRLIAMAGERLSWPGTTEISGVCVHPAYRGRRLARRLVSHVAGCIQARGESPILHCLAENHGAIGLYEAMGFKEVSKIWAARLTPLDL